MYFQEIAQDDFVYLGAMTGEKNKIKFTYTNEIPIDKNSSPRAIYSNDDILIAFGSQSSAATNEVISIRNKNDSSQQTYVQNIEIPAGLHTLEISWTGTRYDIILDGVTQNVVSAATHAPKITTSTNTWLGIAGTSSTLGFWSINGLVVDVEFYDGSNVLVNSYQGYGNTNADWEDQIGSNNGTVVGSPELFTGQGFDGTVSKWYDQSGNDNHATQGTAASQPKIVDAGVYLGELDFDGTDDNLALSGSGLDLFRDVGYGQIFSVITPDNVGTGINRYFEALGGSGARFLLGDSQDYAASSRIGGRRLDADGFEDIESLTSHSNNETLITGFLNWADADAYLYFNGTERASSTSFQTAGNTSNTSSAEIAIGGTSLRGDFKTKEIIIYNTDQSDNRTAIEANIGETYGITGIPAYDNTVDGFVETWYDQSGNGNDATQSVTGNQPKIVDAGALVTGGIDFDGVDDFFELTSAISTSTDFSTFQLLNRITSTDPIIGISSNQTFGSVVSPLYTSGTTWYTSSRSEVRTVTNSTVGDTLVTTISESTGISMFQDGTGISLSAPSAVTRTGDFERIGARNGAYGKVKLEEIIIYPSDQSATRTAIEGNINAHYDIYS
jgi:hypothetical protein